MLITLRFFIQHCCIVDSWKKLTEASKTKNSARYVYSLAYIKMGLEFKTDVQFLRFNDMFVRTYFTGTFKFFFLKICAVCHYRSSQKIELFKYFSADMRFFTKVANIWQKKFVKKCSRGHMTAACIFSYWIKTYSSIIKGIKTTKSWILTLWRNGSSDSEPKVSVRALIYSPIETRSFSVWPLSEFKFNVTLEIFSKCSDQELHAEQSRLACLRGKLYKMRIYFQMNP